MHDDNGGNFEIRRRMEGNRKSPQDFCKIIFGITNTSANGISVKRIRMGKQKRNSCGESY
jgi:hypothetical protein